MISKFFGFDPDEPAEAALKRYYSYSEIPFGFIAFSAIFVYRLELPKYFSSKSIEEAAKVALKQLEDRNFESVGPFLSQHWLHIALAYVTYRWWNSFSGSVYKEMEFLIKVYNDNKIRPMLKSIINFRMIPFLSPLISITFLILAYFIIDIYAYAVVTLILNIQNMIGNRTIIQQLRKHFIEKETKIKIQYDEYASQKEKIAEKYWIDKPQMERIGLLMISACIIIIIGYSNTELNIKIPVLVPYCITILTIIINELVMKIWRKERDDALAALELEHDHVQGFVRV